MPGVRCLLFPMSIHLPRTRWFALAGVALASIGLGFAGAKILANETIGYLAGYTWFGLTVIGVPLVLSLLVIGAILSFNPKMRWSGGLAIISAVLIVGSSLASFKSWMLLDSSLQARTNGSKSGPKYGQVWSSISNMGPLMIRSNIFGRMSFRILTLKVAAITIGTESACFRESIRQ